MEQGYSQREAAKISGVAQTKLSRLKKSGAIIPDLPDGKYSAALIDKIRAEYGKPVTSNNAPVDAQEAAQATEMPADEQTPVADETPAQVVSEENLPTQNETDTITIEVPFKLVTLDERAARIRKLSADVQRGIIEIGNELIAAKRDMGHGNWGTWLKNEFDWTQQTANRFMRVADRFGKLNTGVQFKSATLQAMLALPFGTEQEFIDEQAEKGKPVEEMTKREVQSAVKEFNRQRDEEFDSNNPVGDETADTGDSRIFDREFFDTTQSENHAAESPTIDEKFSDSNIGNEQSETVKEPPPPVTYNHNGSVEYYTPEKYINAARRVLGEIDLDPASSELANETVKAKVFYTKDDDGLSKDWRGRIWMNPPYSKGVIDKFVDKLCFSPWVEAAIVLVPARTDRSWFEMLAIFSSAMVFTNHRVKCLRNGVDDTSGPTAGSVFFYIGKDPENFLAEFHEFGWCAQSIPVPPAPKKNSRDESTGESVNTDE